MLLASRDKGASLVEVVCGICLLGIVGLLASATLHGAKTTAVNADALYHRESALDATKFYLRKSFLASDTHRLNIPSRIHKNGDIRYTDGSPHLMMQLTEASRPKSNSDVITSSTVYPGLLLTVLNPTHGTIFSGIQACGARAIPDDVFRSFFALSKRGISYFSGEARSDGGFCLQINGSLKPHLSLIETVSNMDDFQTILPIDSDFALFVDTTNQLRLVSFAGDEILENQPITSGIDSLRMTISEANSQDSLVPFLETEITLTGGFSITDTIYARVARTPHWNALLWSWNEK